MNGEKVIIGLLNTAITEIELEILEKEKELNKYIDILKENKDMNGNS